MNTLKYYLFGALLLSASNTAFSDSRFNCNTLHLQNAEPLIEDMIDRILTIGNIHQKYNVCRMPYSSNATAVIYEKKRVIAYDPAYLNLLAAESGEMHWGKVTVLAHEIGHHILRHTDKSESLRKLPEWKRLSIHRKFELQADQFAGKVLANMGASLSNTQALIRLLKIHKNVSLSAHPDADKRVAAVTRGWNIGCQQAGRECNSQIAKNRATRKNYQSPLGRAATANYSRFMRQADALKGTKVDRKYCNLYASLAVHQTNRSIQHKCGFNVGSYGSPWSRVAAPQSNWCMKVSSYATSREAKFRETKLASCIAKNQQRNRANSTRNPTNRKTTPNYRRFIQWSKKLNGQRASRAYCTSYAKLATQQTKRNNQYHCGFNRGDTANRWSSAFAPQFNWCLQVRPSITAGEASYRENKLAVCVR